VKILFLSQRVPYPPNRGDKISTWRLINRLRQDHEVAVIAFAHDEADRQGAQDLRGMGFETTAIPLNQKLRKLLALPLLFTNKALTLGVFGSSQLQAEVDRKLEWADAAYAFSSSMGAFLVGRGLPWVMHFAELDSDKWKQYAASKPFPLDAIYRREWRTLLAYERKLAADTVTNVFCTPIEEAIFEEQIPGRPSLVLRNGVDLEYFQPQPDKTEREHLVFTGVMDYYPNVDGCVHFVNEVFPIIRAEVPDCRFTIVGSRPTAQIQQLAEVDGVSVTGFVDDIRTYLARATISVAPLRIARGIQNKVLEAMSSGLPVVGTTSATQGVEGQPGRDFLLADSVEDQAAAILGLLRDPTEANALGQRARRFVEQNYDWAETLKPLDGILAQLSQQV
jgi:sugar transferase (PEP-CTERM/EpsH1 system associated)